MNRIDHTSTLEKESYEAPLAIAFRLESRANILVGFLLLMGIFPTPKRERALILTTSTGTLATSPHPDTR